MWNFFQWGHRFFCTIKSCLIFVFFNNWGMKRGRRYVSERDLFFSVCIRQSSKSHHLVRISAHKSNFIQKVGWNLSYFNLLLQIRQPVVFSILNCSQQRNRFKIYSLFLNSDQKALTIRYFDIFTCLFFFKQAIQLLKCYISVRIHKFYW